MEESDSAPAFFSEALPRSTSAEYFLTWFISLSLLGVGCKIHRDRADAQRSNNSTEERVYCINTEGSRLLHIQPSAQTLHYAVGISSLCARCVDF